MAQITVTEKDTNINNLFYVQSVLGELLSGAGCKLKNYKAGARAVLSVDCPDKYADIVRAEIADKLAEVVAINYKYHFFKKKVHVNGLKPVEKEILIASLIAADLDEDKKYSYERFKGLGEMAIDGIYNFRLQPLKNKWEDIASYMPVCFVNSQLKDFISYLLENKQKRIYIDGGKVYDSHFRRLKRCELLGGGSEASIIREVLLSNCGEIELTGSLPEEDEFYLKEYYTDKIVFNGKYFS